MTTENRKVAFICSKGALDMAYPALVMGWAALGNALSMLARHAEAIAALEKAADLGPGDARVLYALGVALARSGEQTRAETVRVSLAGVDPDMAAQLLHTDLNVVHPDEMVLLLN